jgi:hypothetical protein
MEDSMTDETTGSEQGGLEPSEGVHTEFGAPSGARQNVRNDTMQGAVARPGGATQNSGGAIASNDDELGHGPGRGAD